MTKIESLWLKLTYIYYTRHFYFAHHPLCHTYQKEVIRLGSYYLCKGCFTGYLALFIVFIAALIDHFSFQWLSKGSITVFGPLILGLLLPSFISIFFSFPRYIKTFIRFLLGLGVGLSFVVAMFYPNYWVKGISLAGFSIAYYAFTRIRKKYRKDDCQGCKELHDNQSAVCSGFVIQQEAINRWEKYASSYLSKNHPRF